MSESSNTFLWLHRLLVGCIAGLVLYSLSKTIYTAPPVESADVVIMIKQNDGNYSLTEVRKMVGYEKAHVRLTHTFYQENNTSNFFTVRGGIIDVIEGEFTSFYTTPLPSWVKGRWCTRTKIIYRPALSQREHSYPTTDVCFETTDYD